MFHAPAEVWNRIAERELRSDLAMRLFPLPAAQMDAALEEELATMQAAGVPPIVAAAFLKVAPSLWEADAIRDYQAEMGTTEPPVAESIDQALAIAEGDLRLEPAERDRLRDLLLIQA